MDAVVVMDLGGGLQLKGGLQFGSTLGERCCVARLDERLTDSMPSIDERHYSSACLQIEVKRVNPGLLLELISRFFVDLEMSFIPYSEKDDGGRTGIARSWQRDGFAHGLLHGYLNQVHSRSEFDKVRDGVAAKTWCHLKQIDFVLRPDEVAIEYSISHTKFVPYRFDLLEKLSLCRFG